jgi:hypothetical protein
MVMAKLDGRGAFAVRVGAAALAAGLVFAQQPPDPPNPVTASTAAPDTIDKRIFGIIPNARSSRSLAHYEPLTVRQKFKIASDDCFDRGTIFLGLVFGAESQLTRSEPSFGNGVPAYGKYFGTAYGDLLIGNMMTEGVYPSLLHQDPRYFRMGTGSKKSRLVYSIKQIVWTRTDSGRGQFNYSEFVGNATAVAISNAYYPDSRTAGDAVVKLTTQVAVDLAANILKEFGPDITRRLTRKRDQK